MAFLTGQMAALLALTAWFGNGMGGIPEFNGDGVATTLVIAASTPVEILLLVLFTQRVSERAARYLGLVWPRRGEAVFGVGVIVVMIGVSNLGSWLAGPPLVTRFQ